MKTWIKILLLACTTGFLSAKAQVDGFDGRQGHKAKDVGRDSLSFTGQVSGWVLFSKDNALPVWIGGRYLPQLNYMFGKSKQLGWSGQTGQTEGARRTEETGGTDETGQTEETGGMDETGGTYETEMSEKTQKKGMFDAELSLNVNGLAGFKPFTQNVADGNVKLYRGWVRYSGEQFEVRAGLQKINFGSATLLRPLMWFDKIDPRDPLQLTDGVWGLLGRYYFLNNLNVWAWVLYGNKQPSLWESVESNDRLPEFGGRAQFPLKKGELAFSFHHRTADSRHLEKIDPRAYYGDDIPENRFGFDGRWDVEVGIWFEASWTRKEKNVDPFTNLHLLNLGMDYTFGIGNGLSWTMEHLVATDNYKLFNYREATNFTALSLSYPFGITDNLSAIFYYDWGNRNFYHFVNWNRQINRFSFYVLAFVNPQTNAIPISKDSFNLMGGTGVQLMVVYNY